MTRLATLGRRLLRNPLSAFGLAVIALLVLAAALAPLLAPYPGDALGATVRPDRQFEPPGEEFWFGTDDLGRDLFSRVLFGARISLLAGCMTIGLALVIGVPLGLLAGYAGGLTDEAIMRVTDVMLSFPPLLLAVAIAAAFGPSLTNAVIATGLSWWPWYTRIIRSTAAGLRRREYVEAARAAGAGHLAIMGRHILPNALPPVLVQASMDFGSVVLTTAALGFLGLGAQAPQPEWGLMVAIGRNYFLTQPWVVVFPGLGILITVMAFNFLGDGLREVLDPRLSRARR
ncbi:MAG TPA: ABC transporter permease [Bacillota bacterium]